MQRFIYRKAFGLSAEEMDREPIDEFFINLAIYGHIKEKNKLEMKHGSS